MQFVAGCFFLAGGCVHFWLCDDVLEEAAVSGSVLGNRGTEHRPHSRDLRQSSFIHGYTGESNVPPLAISQSPETFIWSISHTLRFSQ